MKIFKRRQERIIKKKKKKHHNLTMAEKHLVKSTETNKRKKEHYCCRKPTCGAADIFLHFSADFTIKHMITSVHDKDVHHADGSAGGWKLTPKKDCRAPAVNLSALQFTR